MTYQPRPRRKTVLAVAWVLKIFCLFLNDRAKTMPDVLQARDLSADLMKEFAVWLVARRRLQRKTAATVYGTCACFLRRAKRVFAEDFDPFFRTPGICLTEQMVTVRSQRRSREPTFRRSWLRRNGMSGKSGKPIKSETCLPARSNSSLSWC